MNNRSISRQFPSQAKFALSSLSPPNGGNASIQYYFRYLYVIAVVACVAQGSARAVTPISADKISPYILAHQKEKICPSGVSAEVHRKSLVSRGLNADKLEAEDCALYATNKLSKAEIAQLAGEGIIVTPDLWIPPIEGQHPFGFHLASVSYDSLDYIRADSRFASLASTEFQSRPMNDVGGTMIRTDDIHDGIGVTACDGAGVTIAVADSGLDLTHGDIPTPIEKYDMTTGTSPATWSTVVKNTVSEHGTHVVGSVLGRGTLSGGKYEGSAPGASLCFYKIGNNSNGNASHTDEIEAINRAVTAGADIFTMSYGGFSTFMDGSEPVEQAIDAAVAAGVVVFISAGNEADEGAHYSIRVDPGSSKSFTYVIDNSSSGSTYTSNETIQVIWRDDCYIDYNVTLSCSTLEFPWESLSIFPVSEASSRGTESRRYELKPNVAAGASKTYTFTLQNAAGSSPTLVHCYQTGGKGTFTSPDSSYTITCPATADGAIAVGAWTHRDSWQTYKGAYIGYNNLTNNTFAAFSSRGPRIDGVLKPSFVAPGAGMISARDSVAGLAADDNRIIDNDGQNLNGSGPANYYVLQGTSMACPLAAGVAALVLQKNPTWTPAQVKAALTNTASISATPNNSVGHGMIDAVAAATYGSSPVAISVQPQSRTSHTGFPVSFSVTATGETPRYYQWQKNSVDIPSATSASYAIASVSAGDAGSYRCRVSNAVNAVMSDAATLTVLPAAPSAIWASATNVTSFTAAWNSVSDASSYRLDVASSAVFGGGVSDLIISEYVEGSATEKFIEIYNGTGSEVDLSDYRLIRYANGSTSPTEDTTLSGLLGDGEVVVYCNPLSTLYACETNRAVNFNGNDAVVLFKISAASPVDIFGCIGENPGDAWTNGSFTTVNKTLVRKSSVVEGVTENLGGFPTLATEWEQYDQDTIYFLGTHDCDGGGGVPPSYVTGYSNRYVSGTSQNVTGLAGDTVYYFRARAVNGSGTGRNSPVGSVRTWRVPTFSGNPGPVATTASVPVAFTVGATGNPDPALALRSTTASGGYEFSPGSGRLDYTPPQADAGTRTFTFTASNRAGVATQTVSVGVTAGIAPAFTSGAGPYSTTVDVAVAFSVGASGRPAPTLALQSTTATGSYSFAAGTGQMNFTPSSNDVGTRTFTFTASNFLGVATQAVSVATMGLVPAFVPNPGPLGATTSVEMAFSVGASGVPPPVLAVADTTASGGYGFTPETGELAYTPPEVDAGLRTFTFTASNSAGVATQAVDISVAPGIPSAPGSLWAAETNIVDFRAEWSSVPIATSYQLDVATNEAFMAGGGEGGQFLLASNAATSTNLFTNEWTASDVASTTYIQMLKPTSAITSPAFSTAGFTNLTVDFRARTYNGTASGSTNVTVSISTNNGLDWSVVGVVAPALNTMATMPTLAHAANLGGNQTRIRWQTLGASGFIGVGVSNLVVQGWSPGSSPSFVAGYSNRPVGGTSVSVTGLVAETPYYFRVRAISTGGTGTYSAVAGVTTDVKSAAAVFLRDLDQTYDGTARTVAATTMPAGLTVEFTYDGHPMAPTNAGSYVVEGTIDDPIHSGSAADTLVVRKAAAAVSLENLAQVYDGTPRNATAATDPPGLAVDLTYDGLAMAPVAAGTYAVTATVNDVNYEGETNGPLAIDKGAATVFLQDLAQTYSGLARTVAATTMPAGLTVEMTYDGQAWAPTNAGSYAVTGTVMDANWEGLADGMLVVAKASQAITAFMPTNGSSYWVTNGVGLSATADSGLDVAFRVAAGPGEIDLAGTNLSFAGAGLVAVEASQGGDANWEPAIPETNIFLVTLPLPAAIWASETNLFDFTAEWSPVPFAEEYRLDVGLNPAFEVAGSPGGQFLLASNAATSTNLFTNEWTASDIASTTYIQMLKPTSAITSPAFSTVGFTNLTVDFRARTYGGVNAAYNAIAVSISEDDGATWTPLGTVLPASATISAMPTLTNEANLGGGQTRICWQTPGASGSIGAGVMNLTVQGWNEGTMTPAFVAGYSNRPVLGTSASVTGLAANTPYYFRACAVSGGEPGLYSAVASVVTKSEATVFLQNLHQTYDGTARTISATTMPVGLEVEITYDGSAVPPTDAGNYAVTGTVVDANHEGWASGILMVSKADQTIDFLAIGDQIATGAVELVATASSGLPVSYSVVHGPAVLAGTELTFSGAGEITVAAWQDGDANWHPAPVATNVFSVEKAVVEVTLNDLSHVYDGTAKAATATTEPSGLAVQITYDGNEWAPTNAGTYAVTGRVDDANYAGETNGLLVISKADQTIDFPALGDQVATGAVELAATASSGLPVSYSVAQGPGVLAGTELTFSGAGEVSIEARQDGDDNWNPAPAVTNVFAVDKAIAEVTLNDLAQTFDGTAKEATATTVPEGLAVEITYDGNAWAPTNAGTYAATGTVADAIYQGSAAGTLAIAKGAAIMELAGLAQTYDGTVRQVTASTEPPGLAVEITYDGGADAPTNAGEYAVTGRVDDVNYAGETNGLLVLSKADQTIDFPLLNDLCVTDKVVLVAVASSGLDVSFSVTNGPAVIAAETNLHFMGTGDVSVVACQIGNGNWNAAPDVCRTLKVFSNLAHVDIATWLRAEIFAGAFNATVTTDPEDAEVDIEVEEASAFDPLSRSFVFQPLDETEYEVDGKDVTVPSAGTNSWRLFRIRAAPR